jgi:hypothetical protein
MANQQTLTCIEGIKRMVAKSRISPTMFTYCFGRSTTSAAFKLALAQGLIKIAYIQNGKTVYERGDNV